MLGSDFLRIARERLFDPAPGSGWSDTELLDYLSQAQRRVCFVKPDSYPVRTTVALAAGALQTLPDDGIALLDIIANTASGNTVSQVNEELLKTSNRYWPAGTQSVDIENYATDARTPRLFLVTPPAQAGTELLIVYGAVPPDVTSPDDTTRLPDSFAPVLIDGMLAQAFGKPSKRQDPSKAAMHLAAFNTAIGVKDRMQSVVAPRPGQ